MFWCFFSSSMASSMSFSGMYSVSFSFTCGHLLSQFPFPLFTFCSNSKPFGTLIVVIRIWGGWRGGRWWRCVTSLSVFFLWDLLPWSFPLPSWGVPFAFLSWFYWLVIWVVSSNWGFSIPCHGVVIYSILFFAYFVLIFHFLPNIRCDDAKAPIRRTWKRKKRTRKLGPTLLARLGRMTSIRAKWRFYEIKFGSKFLKVEWIFLKYITIKFYGFWLHGNPVYLIL